MRVLLPYEGILCDSSSTGDADSERAADLFGMRAEEGAVQGPGCGLRARSPAERNAEASVIAKPRAPANVEQRGLADRGRDRSLAEIGGH